jgi:hypothetical protein
MATPRHSSGAVAAAILLSGIAFAASPGDWCRTLGGSPGLLLDEPESPFIQSLSFRSRLHWQAYAISGSDTAGKSFSNSGTEFRRFRPSVSIGLLRYFTIDASINLVSDRRFAGGEPDWQFQDYDKTLLTFDARKAFGMESLDTLTFSYGRQKLAVTSESLDSSERILTIERSAISNTFFSGRYPTGFSARFGEGPWLATLSYLQGFDDRAFDNSTPGRAWFASLDYTVSENWKLRGDAFLNNFGSSTRVEIPFEKAVSLNATYDRKPFGFLATLAYGDNGNAPGGRGGGFGGIVIMPWFWIVPEKTQAVLQYGLLVSDQASAIRANSHYLSTAPAVVNSGRGDELHTIYAGINQYVCGNNLKLMAGVEFARLHTPIGTADSISSVFAARLSF